MRKLFLAICFNLICIGLLQAKSVEILDKSQLPKPEPHRQQNITKHTISEEEFMSFLAERVDDVLIQSQDELSTKSTNTQLSDQARQAMFESKKSGFQKIYESALKRLENEENNNRPDIDFPVIGNISQEKMPQTQTPDIPVIKTYLPSLSNQIVVPAMEHIPYLMSNIEALPDGVVKFTETIMVIANGKKLRNGLSKVLPQYVISRDSKKQKISYNLINVSANGQSIPYHLSKSGNRILLLPDQDYRLAPGVYTFKFEYTADNLLWDYGNFKELYWDVTGSAWNLVASRVGATLSIPGQHQPIEQNILVGYPSRLTPNDAKIFNLSPQVWGYTATRELFSFESLYLIVSLPSDVVASPSIGKRFMRHIDNYGDVYISLISLIIILVSFVISWKYIRANKGQLKISLRKTPILLRYLVFNRYDLKSFGGFLLEMYRKNIIDIQQSGDTILLVKRTDNLKSLSKAEQKAINYLFTQGEPVLNVNKNNRLKIIRAARVLEKELRRTLLTFMLKLNGGYLFFSLGMLLLGELFIALLGLTPKMTFMVLFIGTIILSVGIYLYNRQGWKAWQKWLFRALGLVTLLPTMVAMSAVVSIWSVVLILLSLLVIRHYTNAYAERGGLLRQYIEDAANQKQSLLKHRENILLGKEIANRQAAIWVLDLEDEFISSGINEYNKLNAMKGFINNQLH